MYKLKGCGDHSCRVEKPVGMGTNGGCKFPEITRLAKQCDLLQGYHDDVEVRRFARSVGYIFNHLEVTK